MVVDTASSSSASSSLLGSSPRSSILSPLMEQAHKDDNAVDSHHDDDEEHAPLSLDDLIDLLPTFLEECKKQQQLQQDLQRDDDQLLENVDESLTRTLADPVGSLLERVHLDESDWERYALVDPNKSYTRNLIATDHETFTLLLLCWTPGHASPVHDHPCDGCWLRVLRGSVREIRYAIAATTATSSEGDESDQDVKSMVCTRDETYHKGVVFITDSQGYHKIENPSSTELAVSLHLYSPPFQQCRVWLDEHRDVPCNSVMCNYSEYGIKTTA